MFTSAFKIEIFCTAFQLLLLDRGRKGHQAVLNLSVGKILGTTDLDLMISIYCAMQRPIQQMKAFMEVWCDLVFWLQEMCHSRLPMFVVSATCLSKESEI